MGKHSTTPETEGSSRTCPFLASGTPGLTSESENTPFRPLAEESKTNPDLKPTAGLRNDARPATPLSPPALPQHGEARLPVPAPPSQRWKERAADGGRRARRAHPAKGPGRVVTAVARRPHRSTTAAPKPSEPRRRLSRQRRRRRPSPFPAREAPRRAARSVTASRGSTATPRRRLLRPQSHPASPAASPRSPPVPRREAAGQPRVPSGPGLATSPAPPAFRHTPRLPPGVGKPRAPFWLRVRPQAGATLRAERP